MAPSTKRIKVYSDVRARIPNDVGDALGMPAHKRQCHVIVVATSKREAIEIAAAHGAYSSTEDMDLRGRVDPEHGDRLDNTGETLRDAGLLHTEAVGACYAEHGRGPVVDLTTPGRDVVGHLVPRAHGSGRGYGFDYRPAQQNDRLRDDIERLHGLAPTLPDADRDALRRVLAAARTTLPTEEN